MKRILMLLLCSLSFVLSCNEEKTTPPTFFFSVQDGESGTGGPVQGATVSVYTSVESWLNGDAPLKSYTSGSDGTVQTSDKYSGSEFIFVEKGNFNNWPACLTYELQPDPSLAATLNGSALLINSYYSLFLTAKNKPFTLSDVLISGASVFGSVSACSKDNSILLKLDQTFDYSEGVNICAGESALVVSSVYAVGSKTNASTSIINNATCFSPFPTTWTEIVYGLYMRSDFTQVLTREYVSSQEVISVYSRLP